MANSSLIYVRFPAISTTMRKCPVYLKYTAGSGASSAFDRTDILSLENFMARNCKGPYRYTRHFYETLQLHLLISFS